MAKKKPARAAARRSKARPNPQRAVRARPAGAAPKGAAARRRPAARARGDLWASLKPNAANFAPLTPVSFLPRSAELHPTASR
jgi:hypothetical protein